MNNQRKGKMPTKKTIKKTTKKTAVKKTAVKPAPVMEHKCACGENCNCHCHGGAHWVKHIIAWAIIFALGMVCGKMLNCGHWQHKHMPQKNPVFINGCLDMASIECPKMQEKIMAADVDGNGCVSLEEYKAVKKEMRQEMKRFGHHGPKGPKPQHEPEMAN